MECRWIPAEILSKEALPSVSWARVFLGGQECMAILFILQFASFLTNLFFLVKFKFRQRIKSSELAAADIAGGTQIFIRSIQRSHLLSDYMSVNDCGRIPLSSSISLLDPFSKNFEFCVSVKI